MSAPEKFTKNEQDFFYLLIQHLKTIEDDLKNAEISMRDGRFFNSMDFVTSSNIRAQIAQRDTAEFVNLLRKKNIW